MTSIEDGGLEGLPSLVRGLLKWLGVTIFETLGRHQREIEELFGDLENAIATSQRELAYVTFQLLSMKLITCMRAEHAVVYPRFEHEARLIDEVAQARREHDAIEHAITRLRVGGLRKEAWVGEISTLRKLVAEHAALEEYTLFPIASLALSSTQLAQIGDDYRAYHAVASTVSGASITYEPAQFEPPPAVVVRFNAA